MTLAELRYLVNLVEARHFGRAAKHCCVSQPTLSMAIKRLEAELGLPLVERSNAGIWPTTEGKRIAARARKALDHIDVMAQLARREVDTEEPLVLGALPSLASGPLPRALPYVRQQLAGPLTLQLDEGDPRALGDRLLRCELDAVFACLPLSLPDVVVRPLYQEPLALLLPETDPLAALTSVPLNELAEREWVLPAQYEGVHHALDKAGLGGVFVNEGQKLRLNNASRDTLGSFVVQGEALSLVPSTWFPSGQGLVTRPLAGVDLARTLALVWRASFPRHRLMDDLTEALQLTASGGWWLSEQNEQSGLLVQNDYW